MKTQDPSLVKLLDQQEKAEAAFFKAFGRLKRSVRIMEKMRRAVLRFQKRIAAQEEAEREAEAARRADRRARNGKGVSP